MKQCKGARKSKQQFTFIVKTVEHLHSISPEREEEYYGSNVCCRQAFLTILAVDINMESDEKEMVD